MAGYFILYDVENDIGIRCTSDKACQTLKTINPKIRVVMHVSGKNISCSKLGDTKDMNSQEYIKWFNENSVKNKFKNTDYVDGCNCWYIKNGKKQQYIFKGVDHESGKFILANRFIDNQVEYVNPEFVFRTSDKFESREMNWYPGQALFHFASGAKISNENVILHDIDFDDNTISYSNINDEAVYEDNFKNFSLRNMR